jgi:outer membrane protein
LNVRKLCCLFTLAAAPCVPLCGQPIFEDEARAESPWEIGFAFGYGKRSNPLVQSDDIPVIVDIDIAWYGKRWFFDNGDVGRTLVDKEHFTLNAVARLNSDRVFFSKTDTEYVELFSFAGATTEMPPQPIEVPDRDYALEAGLELLSDGEWGFAQLAAHRDVSDTHDGYEVFANYGRRFRRNRWFIEPSLGASYKSARMNDYYWGVRPFEANLELPEYSAGAGWNTHARLAASYQITRNWSFVASARYERLSSEAAASPLVAERSVKSAFLGFNFRL